ncbi:MAG: glucose dehydrogenase, partial [Gemmataceae bacterium]
MLRFTSCLVLVSLSVFLVVAAEPNYDPPIAKASEDGQKALQRFRLAEGITGELWAAEPLLANPVAFCLDEQGRCYVAETFRLHKGVTDIRQHMNWLDDDLACRTVQDRIAMYRKHLGKNFDSYAQEHDRIRLLVDTNADGKADKATVFADGFKDAEVGLGSGLLAHRGNLYYTNLPDLWLLKDTKNSGAADVRKSLHNGYGVHVGFLGHDLHGLCIGPDRKLYFSIGDRGLHVVQ